MVAHDHVDAERVRAGPDDVDRLRVAFFRDEKRAVGGGVALLEPVAHHHRLGGGGALVEHRGVGDLEAGQIGDERLEIQQRLEPALGDLGLIRRVGGVPRGIFEDVALDDGRRVGVEVAEADAAAEDLVLAGETAELGEGGAFPGGRGQVEGPPADLRGHGGVDQCVDRIVTQGGEHRGRVGGIFAEMTAGERVGGGEQVARRGHKGAR